MSRRGCASLPAANVSQVGRAGLGVAACLLALALPVWGQFPDVEAAGLRFWERVDARRAIEEVYRSKRLEANPSASAQAVSEGAQEARVRRALRQNWALEQVFGKSISQEALDHELARIVRETKDPETLQRIFDALAGDPYLIKEALVRPLLAERFLLSRYERDPEIHREAREQAELIRAEIPPERFKEFAGEARHSRVTLRRAVSEDARPAGTGAARRKPFRQNAEIELKSKAFERRRRALPLKGQIGPVRELSDGFVIEHLLAEDPDTLVVESLFVPKKPLASWLAETSPLDWEMESLSTSFESVNEWNEPLPLIPQPTALPPGACWERIGPPGPRYGHTAVWTGAEMIVWGGTTFDGGTVLFNTGYRYDPDTTRWTPISTIGAPTPRMYHTAVWTGAEMIVWGGFDDVVDGLTDMSPFTGDLVSDINGDRSAGGIYYPASDTWEALPGAPTEPRFRHTAVWTGTEMIVWGGWQDLTGTAFNTGARYDPSGGTWTALPADCPIVGRFRHTAVWTGAEMIVWGGVPDLLGTRLGDGARYSLAADAWTLVDPTGAPSPRGEHTAVWTGAEMVVWGGTDGTDYFADGGMYDPALDSWASVSPPPAPGEGAGRRGHVAVWTGARMLVWGGQRKEGAEALKDGWEFNPTLPNMVDFTALRLNADGTLKDDVSQEFFVDDDPGTCQTGKCAPAFGPTFGSMAKYVVMGGTSGSFSQIQVVLTTTSNFSCPMYVFTTPNTCWNDGKFTIVEYWDGTSWQVIKLRSGSPCPISDDTRTIGGLSWTRSTLKNDGVIDIDQSYMDLLADGIAACGEADCTDCIDNDGDLFIDEYDNPPDWAPGGFGGVASWGESNDSDGVDNDGDGLIDESSCDDCDDCDDIDCTNGIDDDLDGFIDEADCTDGIDNDGDGFIDETDCTDGIDNDGDGFIDSDDLPCADCDEPLCDDCDDIDCTNGMDDDFDGFIDETNCIDSVDNDFDGLIDELLCVDCDDIDCTNGMDDDGDGLIDETDCTDGVDNDGDFFIDEPDFDCTDGIDNDLDGFIDETNCIDSVDNDFDGPIDEPPCGDCDESPCDDCDDIDCTNGMDDDLDGLIDETDCTDGVDNDSDGFIDEPLCGDCADCADIDCTNDVDDDLDGLADETDCTNGVDDDLDGLADETDCTDGVDSDSDGFIDEFDFDCTDGIDNDGDGFIDETNCTDSVDNDLDGLIDESLSLTCADCADIDCTNGMDDDLDGLIDEFDCTNGMDDDGDGSMDEFIFDVSLYPALDSRLFYMRFWVGPGFGPPTCATSSGVPTQGPPFPCNEAEPEIDQFSPPRAWLPLTTLTNEAGVGIGTEVAAVWDPVGDVDGGRMIVWGGNKQAGNDPSMSGGVFHPFSDPPIWDPDVGVQGGFDNNAPEPRYLHTAVWTGSELIVWGGARVDETSGISLPPTNTGAVYDPALNVWTPTDTKGSSSLSARSEHSAVWDPNSGVSGEMVVFGGKSISGASLCDGGRYDPAVPPANSWSSTGNQATNPLDFVINSIKFSDFTPAFVSPSQTGAAVPDPLIVTSGTITSDFAPPFTLLTSEVGTATLNWQELVHHEIVETQNPVAVTKSDCADFDPIFGVFNCIDREDNDGDCLVDEPMDGEPFVPDFSVGSPATSVVVTYELGHDVGCAESACAAWPGCCSDCADFDSVNNIYNCTNGSDDDGDGLIDETDCAFKCDDCLTSDCAFKCDDCLTSDCADTVDNDGDGLTDEIVGGQCSDCLTSDCIDGADSDGDGLTDEGTDNDGDGLTDEIVGGQCSDCLTSDCIDGADNDGDGLTDEGTDDDGDSLIDEHDCTDGIDNDGDGLIDESGVTECAGVSVVDPNCVVIPLKLFDMLDNCGEADCTNGADDDGDGFIDESEHSLPGLYQGPGTYSLLLRENCDGTADIAALATLDVRTAANVADNTEVILIDPSGTPTTIKDYGDADASPYDVTAEYIAGGPGTYQVRLSEYFGCDDCDDIDCTNDIDDDWDGFIDETDCTNGIDDDGDGSIDEFIGTAEAELVGATLTARRVSVATLCYTLEGNTILTSCAEVALIAPGGTVTILKPFGIMDANPYDVTAFYQEPGTYQIRLSEKLGCSATSMSDPNDKAKLSNAHLFLGLSPRLRHTAVWTGSEMVVWGGYQSWVDAALRVDVALRSGAKYSVDILMQNQWTPADTLSCDEADCTDGIDNDGDGLIDEYFPSPRFGHTSVWDDVNNQMIVFGGYEDWPLWQFKGDGGRYDPALDSWTLLNPLNVPSPRSEHTAVWDDINNEMIIFGGRYGSGLYRGDGGRYDPVGDSWTPIASWSFGGRFGHTAVWDGIDNQMIVWGGFGCSTLPCPLTNYLNTGGRYSAGSSSWTGSISLANAPPPTAFHTTVAVGLGGEPVMLVWGGISENDVATRELGIYYPRCDGIGGVSSLSPGGVGPSCGTVPLSALGDVDGNGCTDGLDLMRLARAFGSECGDGDFLNDTDFDNNDVVNGEDLDRLITNFGGGCGRP